MSPLTHRLVLADEGHRGSVATAALGIMLLCLPVAEQRVRDHYRLAGREAA